jgi:hypothetical protein
MGSGTLATEAGMVSWDLTLRPGAAVEPGLEGRVSWEPIDSSPANVRYDLAFLQESIDEQPPRWSTRIGVQWTTQLDLR